MDVAPIEVLGDVILNTGALMVIDFGLLGDWSHFEPPHIELSDPELTLMANSCVDLEITGPDASAVAAQIDLAAAKGTYVFDMPPDGVDMVRARVAEICEREGLSAAAETIGRLPHGERARRLLAQHPDGVEVPFHGPWAAAMDGLPIGLPMRVLGRRMPEDSPDAGRWQSVWLEVKPGVTVHRSLPSGHVLVDAARLMLCDLDLLAHWNHEDPTDGLFDVVLWGRDVVAVAELVGAVEMPSRGDGIYGWLDVAADRATSAWRELSALREAGESKFAFDVEPHSDHHRLLVATRATATESGTIDLGGSRGLGFFTSWGDGAFPVFRDLDDSGALVRVRIELGCDEIVARSRRMDELWFGELSHSAFVSARVARDGEPVRYMYREHAERTGDSGWCLLAVDESDDYLDDVANVVILPLREIVGREPALETHLGLPAPVAFERQPDGTFVKVPMPARRD
ncbi:MAG: DUF2185 domain-containing protein [Ilumatobacteraceae bacterium]